MAPRCSALDALAGPGCLNTTPIPMHEAGLMTSAIDAVLAQARLHGATRVHRIVLRIGVLAGVEAESLRFAFEVVTRGTPAAEAALEIDRVLARAYCGGCAAEFGVEGGAILACPRCGEVSGDLRQGRELELFRIEMS